MTKTQKKKAEEMLWKYYLSVWNEFKRYYWGDAYAKRHQDLIDKIKEYANVLKIDLDETKFKPVERDFG